MRPAGIGTVAAGAVYVAAVGPRNVVAVAAGVALEAVAAVGAAAVVALIAAVAIVAAVRRTAPCRALWHRRIGRARFLGRGMRVHR